MRLRYKCPPSFKHVDDIPLWKSATTAFLDSIKYGISTVEAFEKGRLATVLVHFSIYVKVFLLMLTVKLCVPVFE